MLWEQIEIWLSGSHYLTQKSSLKNIFSLKGNELVYKLLRLIFKCLVLAMPQPVFTKFKPALFFKCEERCAFFFLIMWTFYINFVNWGEIENCTFLIIIANFVLKLHFCQLLSVYQWILFCTQDNTDQTVLHSKLASVSWKHEFKCHLAFTLESGKKVKFVWCKVMLESCIQPLLGVLGLIWVKCINISAWFSEHQFKSHNFKVVLWRILF